LQSNSSVGDTSAIGGAKAEAFRPYELPLVEGDHVMIAVNENYLQDLQEDYGGVSQKMVEVGSLMLMMRRRRRMVMGTLC
jgi:hypothetical protein